MPRYLTGNSLVSSVRKRAMIPDDTKVYEDDDILAVLNEEMDALLLDKILILHEEHLTTHVDYDINNTGIYDIPHRAVGNKVRDVVIIDNGQHIETFQISISELSNYKYGNETLYRPYFYVESNQIKFISKNLSGQKIRIYYYLRPNLITKENRAAKISSILHTPSQVTITLTDVPKSFSVSKKYDIIGKDSPNKIKYMDLSPNTSSNFSLNNVIFDKTTSLDFSELSVGDFLSFAEESPVPNIPTELHPYLAQLAAVNILESIGDTEGLANAERKLRKMEDSLMNLIDNRVELAPKKIKVRHGCLRESLMSPRRR